MTRKVFWQEPYRTELETHVHDVRGPIVTLEDTIFYAFSGGQESDEGTIGGHRVREARKEGAGIYYALDEGHGLTPGTAVTVRIEWERRYRLMRLHFAAELVLELVSRRVEGIPKIGAHIAQDKARIDFLYPGSIASLLPDISAQALRVVTSNQPIVSAFSDEAAGLRYWEVEGFARVPCGGTHLKRTGEVGEIELKRKNIGKGKERIEVFLKGEPLLPAA